MSGLPESGHGLVIYEYTPKFANAVQTDYFDASVSGLALRVTSKGTKARVKT